MKWKSEGASSEAEREREGGGRAVVFKISVRQTLERIENLWPWHHKDDDDDGATNSAKPPSPCSVLLRIHEDIRVPIEVSFGEVSEASVPTRSLILQWRLFSLITTALFLFGLHWLDGVCARGQEYLQPRFERFKVQSEPLRYRPYISCLLFCCILFLHWQVQRWEMSTTVPQGAFDPGRGPSVTRCGSAPVSVPDIFLKCRILVINIDVNSGFG